MAGPISPQEVQALKSASIPDEVYQIFNDLIAKNWDGQKAIVGQRTAASLVSKTLGDTVQGIYDRHLLDVEEAYREVGWTVEYNKPAFNETYDATFTFRKR